MGEFIDLAAMIIECLTKPGHILTYTIQLFSHNRDGLLQLHNSLERKIMSVWLVARGSNLWQLTGRNVSFCIGLPRRPTHSGRP